jgi:TolA-binding protein
MKKLINHGILITALLAGTALPLAAQTSGNTGETDHHQSHAQRKEMREKMAAQVKAQDAELEQLVKRMNNAPEAQKADATAAVVSKLVADRLAIHQQLETLHQQKGGTNEPQEQGTGTTPPSP